MTPREERIPAGWSRLLLLHEQFVNLAMHALQLFPSAGQAHEMREWVLA
ncbi:hypothetical protein HLH36_05075 [Gluconacetobacter aggeris]|uniref:Uncharacterized protein n=1 Tax=Gluconacetobacter aggeris TaxID=1286186 RepID=A0A7W4IRI0_9PROT|nr:hypothetical protein [Gluconacetobacter aggeris]MBB2167731.1 hypothetical protein [Gluconacetobacter aggeris]